jgi:flagellar biosynthetic protein FliR
MTNASDVFSFGPFLGVVLAAGMRVSGMMVFAPFLAGSAIPAYVKAALTVALTILLSPLLPAVALTPSPFELVRIITGELSVGLLLGMTLTFVMDAVQLAGQVLGIQMGFSLVNIIDPQTQVDTPVLSIFHELVALLLFLHLNVHHWLLRGLARSFSYLPVGTATASLASTNLFFHSAAGIFLAGLQMAAPVLAATLIADIMLGFLGKASPNLPVLFVGLSVKSLLGLTVAIAALAAWPRLLEKQFTTAIEAGENLLRLAR